MEFPDNRFYKLMTPVGLQKTDRSFFLCARQGAQKKKADGKMKEKVEPI